MRSHRRVTRLLLMPLLALVPLVSGGCQLLGSTSRVSFATDPPGAKIVIDGEESGFVTPYHLSIDRHASRIELQLEGYRTVTRRIVPGIRRGSREWDQMDMSYLTFRFPLWLPWADIRTLYYRDRVLTPGNIFVRLERVVPS